MLNTTSSGMSRAPTSPMTSRTVAIWPAGSGCAASTTCTIRSASPTSSSVERNASTSWCGRLRTKPDGVGDRVHAAVGRGVAAHGGVEGREQRVLDEHAGARDAVQEARLAGVRVAGDRDRRHRVALAVGPLGLARGLHADDLLAQLRHARVDAATVEFDLRLTGTTRAHAGTGAADLATGLAGHRLAPAAQARQQVLELRELDLRLALAALRVLAEDVEDDGRAVDDLDLHDVFERTPLARGELGVGDHGVGAERGDDVPQLLGLAAAEVGAGVGVRAPLQQAVEHARTGRLGEGGELAHRVLGVVLRALRVHADEHDVLEPQLPVLDLGDVFELGGEPADAAERRTLLAVVLLAVGRAVARGIRRVASGSPRRRRRRTGPRPPSTPRCAAPARRRRLRWCVRLRSSCQPYFSSCAIACSAWRSDHYFSSSPRSDSSTRTIRVAPRRSRPRRHRPRAASSAPSTSTTAPACCSTTVPAPPARGNLLDLGCGWGPIALTPRAASHPMPRCGRSTSTNAHSTWCDATPPARPHQCQRRAARTMFPATCASRRSGRTRPSGSARTNCTPCSSTGSPGSTDDATRLARGARSTSAPIRCSAGSPTPSDFDVERAAHPRASGCCERAASLRNGTDAADRASISAVAAQQLSTPSKTSSAGPAERHVLAVVGREHAHAEHAARHLTRQSFGRAVAGPVPHRERRCDRAGAAGERLARRRARAPACGCGRRRPRRAGRPARRTRRSRRRRARARARAGTRGRAPSSSSSSARATTTCGLPTSMPSPGRATGEALGAHERLAAVEAPAAEVDLEAVGGAAHAAHARAGADRDRVARRRARARPWSSR